MSTPPQKPPCNQCGQPLVWAPDVQQWFCNNCQKYFEPAHSTKGSLDKLFDSVDRGFEGKTYRCQTCGNRINFVQQYQRWYCGFCQKYI